MPNANKLDERALEQVAAMFWGLADASRLALLQEMKEGELLVGELSERTGMAQASVSKHLKTLYDQGLVERRREGTKAYYGLRGELVMELCRLVCTRLMEDQQRFVNFEI